MRKSAPFNVIVHAPTTEAGRKELARRVSGVQADFVTDSLCRLNCPPAQKQALLNAVIDAVRRAETSAAQEAATSKQE